MKETLAKVGRTLIRIFLITLILTSIKSCASAWTWDDFIEHCGNIDQTPMTGQAVTVADTIYNNASTIESALSNAGYDVDNYDSFLCFDDGNGYVLHMTTNSVSISFNYKVGGVTKHFYTSGWSQSPQINISNYQVYKFNTSAYYGSNAVIGLINNNTNFGMNQDYLGNKYMGVVDVYPIPFDLTNRNWEQNIQLTYAIIGSAYYDQNYNWYLFKNGTYIELLKNATQVNTGYDFTILINEEISNYIQNLEEYKLIYGTPEYTRLSGDQIITFLVDSSEEETSGESYTPSGQITNASGENTGNIDLGGLQEQIGSQTQAIENIPEEIGKTLYNSGESGEKGIFQKVYDDLFKVDEEDINQVITQAMGQIEISSGELAEVNQILGYLSGEPGDFIISWGNLETHFSISGEQINTQLIIPANQINFSEMERNSKELQQAMNWARIITNVSIFSLIVHETYILLLATLGVPVAIYGRKLEEKAQLQGEQQRNEQRWQDQYETQRYNEWLYNHRK